MTRCITTFDDLWVDECRIGSGNIQNSCFEFDETPLEMERCSNDVFEPEMLCGNAAFRSLPAEQQVSLLEAAGTLKTGQLIFQTIPAPMAENITGINAVEVIETAMDSRINHVGILRHVNGSWRVIEAEASGVRYTKLKDFIGRNLAQYWFKEFAFFREKPEAAERFIDRAHGFWGRPYDFKYQEGAERIYCSELVDLALQGSGKTLNHLKIPAAWLNGYDWSVRLYLAMYHRIFQLASVPKDWVLLSTHVLFYADDLLDPQRLPPGFINTPDEGFRNNMLYDTVPGTTVAEKLEFLKETWGSHLRNVTVLTSAMPKSDAVNFLFRYLEEDSSKGVIQHSLMLFPIFSEERQLLEGLRKFIMF